MEIFLIGGEIIKIEYEADDDNFDYSDLAEDLKNSTKVGEYWHASNWNDFSVEFNGLPIDYINTKQIIGYIFN